MNLYAKYFAPYLKGHFAGLGIGIGLVIADMQSNPVHNLGALTGYQWIAAIGATLGLGAAVGSVTNAPKPDGTVANVSVPATVQVPAGVLTGADVQASASADVPISDGGVQDDGAPVGSA